MIVSHPRSDLLCGGGNRSDGVDPSMVIRDQLPEGPNPELSGGWPMILPGLKAWLESGELLTTPGSLRWIGSPDRAADAPTSREHPSEARRCCARHVA